MPVTAQIRNPLYSFTKIVPDIINIPCLDIEITKCLPLSYERPITHSFQFKLDETTDENSRTSYFASPVSSCCAGGLPSEVPLNKPMPYIYKATKRLLDGETDKYVLNFWENINDVDSYEIYNTYISEFDLDICPISCNENIVFEIVQLVEEFNGLSWVPTARNHKGFTNCFQLFCGDDCFKSLVEYKCNEDSFDFIYQGGTFFNRQVLPINLNRPQILSEQQSYRKSNGEYIKRSERLDEKWLLETDWLYYGIHKYIKVALAHDILKIYNELHRAFNVATVVDNDNPSFICEAEYSIEWNEFLTLEAKGKTELKTRYPYYLLNNNCG